MTPVPGPLVDPATVPGWLAGLVAATARLDPAMFRRHVGQTPAGARPAAVLILLGETGGGPDVLLLRRADTLGTHPGQVAFPGGAADAGDDGPVSTALREAAEEVGVLPATVRPLAVLPSLYVPVSGFDVTPVLAHWSRPGPVRAVDPAETASVARIPLAMLTDPANRIQVRHPSGMISPGYLVPGMLIWGLTAGLLTVLLSIGGWDRPWDTTDVRELDAAWQVVLELAAGGVTGDVSGIPPAADGSLPPANAEESW